MNTTPSLYTCCVKLTLKQLKIVVSERNAARLEDILPPDGVSFRCCFVLCSQFNSKCLQTVQNLIHNRSCFLVLQRVILSAEGNGIRHRLKSRKNLSSLVDVEQLVALKKLSASLLNHILDLAYQYILISLDTAGYFAMPVYLRSNVVNGIIEGMSITATYVLSPIL